MTTLSFTGLINNVALLVAMGVLYCYVKSFKYSGQWPAKLIGGLFLGLVSVGVMLNPWEMMPGVIFDSRSVLLSVGGLFLGFVPIMVAGLIAGIYRFLIGGTGAFAGVAVIVSSCAIGVLWAFLRKKPATALSGWEHYVFGVVVHVNMMLWMLTLPSPTNIEVIKSLSLPVMLILPIGSFLFARLLKGQASQHEDKVKLQESEERYRSLIDMARDAVAVYRDMKVIFVNRAAINMYNAPPGVDMVGMPILDFVDPEHHEFAVERMKRMMSTGQGEPLGRLKIRRYDGSTVAAEINSTPIIYSGEQAVLLSIRDISERIRSEKELGESRRLLLETSHMAHVGGWDIDLASNRLRWTPETYRILELSEETRPDLDTTINYCHPDDREMVKSAVMACIKDGKDFQFEARVKTDKNHLRWVRVAGVAVYDDGKQTGLRGITQDITNRRLAENHLRDSETRYRTLVENAPFCIHEIDLEGKLISMNRSGLRMMGVESEAQISGLSYLSTVHESNRDKVEELLQSAINGNAHQFEFLSSGEHNPRQHRSSFVPIRDEKGTVQRLMGITEDITDRKKAEAELARHRQQLEELVELRTRQLSESRQLAEEANRAKSAFLANMSHEIRTPMNAIIGLTHLLQQGEMTEKQLDQLQKIDHAGAYLLTIINDILDISKIEAGKLVLEESDFSIDRILENVRSLLKGQLDTRPVELRLETRRLREWWRGDATRLRQCLLNYTANALKFTRRGTVTIRARELESYDDGALVRFEVEDTGIGIAQEKIDRLFQPFEQADASTTREYGGTGLGLAITERLANLMGGTAGAESETGKGSLFWFTARLKHGESGVAETTTSMGSVIGQYPGLRILVAEDNDINREIAAELLQKAGIKPDLATNGNEAVEMVCENDYDLVFMDIQMPELDGLEATRMIRAMKNDDGSRSSRSHTPIVAMTANVYEEDRKACLKAGMNDFLAKPVRPQNLFKMIERWSRKLPGRVTRH